MFPTKLVDVVIPTRPHSPFLFEAIESVLRQSMQEFNLLVVINGHSRKLEKKLKHCGISFCNEPQLGAGWARWCGVKATTSPYVFFLDSDDILLPQAIELCLRSASPEVDLIHGRIKNFSSKHESPTMTIKGREGFLSPLASNSLVLRDTFDKYPFLDFSNTSWLQWIASSRSSGMRIKSIDDLICLRRVHDENLSRSVSVKLDLIDFVIRHHLKRH